MALMGDRRILQRLLALERQQASTQMMLNRIEERLELMHKLLDEKESN